MGTPGIAPRAATGPSVLLVGIAILETDVRFQPQSGPWRLALVGVGGLPRRGPEATAACLKSDPSVDATGCIWTSRRPCLHRLVVAESAVIATSNAVSCCVPSATHVSLLVNGVVDAVRANPEWTGLVNTAVLPRGQRRRRAGSGGRRPDVSLPLLDDESATPTCRLVRQLACLRVDHHPDDHRQLHRHGLRLEAAQRRQVQDLAEDGECEAVPRSPFFSPNFLVLCPTGGPGAHILHHLHHRDVTQILVNGKQVTTRSDSSPSSSFAGAPRFWPWDSSCTKTATCGTCGTSWTSSSWSRGKGPL